MQIATNYEEAKKLHPKEVEECIQMLRKTKSKFKDEKPENLKWEYHVCQRIHGCTFNDVVVNIGKPKEKEPSSADEYFETIRNDIFTHVGCAGVGSVKFYYCKEKIKPVPPAVEKQYKDNWNEDDKERKRFEALPKAEQEKEIAGILKDLSDMGGGSFISLKVTKE